MMFSIKKIKFYIKIKSYVSNRVKRRRKKRRKLKCMKLVLTLLK